MKLTCTTSMVLSKKIIYYYTTPLSWLCTRGTLYHRYTYGTCDMCTRGTHVYYVLTEIPFRLSAFSFQLPW